MTCGGWYMMKSANTTRTQLTRLIFTVFLALSVSAFVGQAAFGGPDCGTKTDKAGCGVKTCAAKASCDKAAGVKADADATPQKSKEEFLAKCLALGMDQEQAEACWVTYAEGKTSSATASTGCPNATKASATGQAKAGCPGMLKTADAKAGETCTKEQCISRLLAQGLTKEAAEAKYAACMVDGKCTGKCGTDKAGCAATAAAGGSK
jgi:hypothetical protein